MERREILTLFSSGIISGGFYKYNFISQSSLAANISISDIHIPENHIDKKLIFKFNKFNLFTSNIDSNKKITIKLNGKLGQDDNYTNLYTNSSINITEDDNYSKDITNQINNFSLEVLNISDEINKKGDTVDIDFEICINHEDIQEITKTDSITIEVTESELPSAVTYGFETGDTLNWVVNGKLNAVTDTVYNGSYSGKITKSSGIEPVAYAIPYEGGNKLSSFEFYWKETSAQSGGGIRLLNSNGDVEAGFATTNPQWVIDDGNGATEVYNGDGYNRWIRFTITFNWGSGTFDVSFEDLSSGSTFTSSERPLKQSIDIEKINIENHNHIGSWQGEGTMEMWFDNIVAKS